MQQTTTSGGTREDRAAALTRTLRNLVRAARGADTVPLGGRVDPRRMTPRQVAAWAEELYADGMMTWQEYAQAGFPAELHPHYQRTIGALTGDRAQPDRPRDMIAVWEDRLEREARLLGKSSDAARVSARILDLLHWQQSVLVSPEEKAA